MPKQIENLQAWQKARLLTKNIYSFTKEGAVSRDHGFCSQIQRAAVSVMTNIAEGQGYDSDKQFNRFLDIARASGKEVLSLLYVALDVKYIEHDKFDELYQLTTEVTSMIYGLKKYLTSQPSK